MNEDFVTKIEFELAQMQRKLDEAAAKIDASVSKFDARAKAKPEKRGTDRIFWGIFLVLLGGLWLANSAGWITFSVSWWPIIVIAFGVYLMLGGR
jgi:O-antigen/teichoic acid export membrane protein